MDQETQRQPPRVAVDQAEFRLQHIHTLLGVLEPVAGDAGAEPREDRVNAFLHPDEGETGENRQADPGLDRTGDLRARDTQQEDHQAQTGEHDLRQELGGDIDDRRRGGGVPLDAVQGDRAGAKDEAADLGER